MHMYRISFYIKKQFVVGFSIDALCDYIEVYVGPIYILLSYHKDAKGVRFFHD